MISTIPTQSSLHAGDTQSRRLMQQFNLKNWTSSNSEKTWLRVLQDNFQSTSVIKIGPPCSQASTFSLISLCTKTKKKQKEKPNNWKRKVVSLSEENYLKWLSRNQEKLWNQNKSTAWRIQRMTKIIITNQSNTKTTNSMVWIGRSSIIKEKELIVIWIMKCLKRRVKLRE